MVLSNVGKNKGKTDSSSTWPSRKLARAIGCSALALLSIPAGAAQARLEEVIVTAQKQEENIQTVPLAITAVTAAELQQKGITSMAGLAEATPSISFSPFPGASDTLILYMRGQGNPNPAVFTSEGAVGMYEDGFIIARPNAATFDLADIERVEVLRGPQGTLYGRNTTGGAINLISKQPTGQFDFKQQFSFGTRDLFRSLTAIDLPKWGDVSTKVTYLRRSIDGYVKNSGSSHDFGEEQQHAGRFSAHWLVNNDFTVDYFLEKGQLASTPAYYQNASLNGTTPPGSSSIYLSPDRPLRRTYRPVDLQISTTNIEGHGLTLTWDIDSSLSIKSLTGYRSLNGEGFQDYVEAFGYGYNSDGKLDTHHFSQEFTVVGSAFDSRLEYTAGLYYFDEIGDSSGSANITGFNISSELKGESESHAAYGQVIWTPNILDDHLSFTVGGRYTKDKRHARRFQTLMGSPAQDDGAANDVTFSRVNPMFTVNYQWTDDLSTYAKVATGYRSGGSYEAAPPNHFGDTFAPEDLTSYELGLKSYWFEHRVRLNMAAFDAKYKDMQLSLQVDPNNVGTTQIYNAGRATIKGLEVELLVAPIEDLTFNLSYSYLNTNFNRVDVIAGTIFDHNVNIASPYTADDNIKNLFGLPHAPKHSIDLGSDYNFLHFDGGSMSAHVDYRWQARAYQTPASGVDVPGRDFNSQPAYGLFNGRLSLALDLPRGDHATIALWGKNLLHKEYQQQVIVTGPPVALPNTPAGFTNNAVAWSEPASWGIDLLYQY